MASNQFDHCLKPGTILQSPKLAYRIEKVLGCGGFGITYLATANIKIENVSTIAKFAIKEHFMNVCYRHTDSVTVCNTPHTQEQVLSSRASFRKEAQRLQSICHISKHIVNVNESFDANGTAYYVMEYLEGGNPCQMPEEKAIEMTMQIAMAIDAIHNERILHLDIKPGNIVLQRDVDGSFYPVVIDFGIAKHFTQTGTMTGNESFAGLTPGFAPQEQYAGIKEFDPRYDIYALGALLLYLTTGRTPPIAFKIDSSQQAIKDLFTPDLSPNVASVILGAMQPQAALRTPDCKTLIAQLKAAQEQKPSPKGLNDWTEETNNALLPPTEDLDKTVPNPGPTTPLEEITVPQKKKFTPGKIALFASIPLAAIIITIASIFLVDYSKTKRAESAFYDACAQADSITFAEITAIQTHDGIPAKENADALGVAIDTYSRACQDAPSSIKDKSKYEKKIALLSDLRDEIHAFEEAAWQSHLAEECDMQQEYLDQTERKRLCANNINDFINQISRLQ